MKFSDLILPVEEETQTIKFNDKDIVVKQYLPIEEKLRLITNVINNCRDNNNFVNPLKLELYGALEIIKFYTDIEFDDEKSLTESIGKTYDYCECSDLFNSIFEVIPEEELNYINELISDMAEKYYGYLNSLVGVMDTIAYSYDDASINAETINNKIANPENLKLVKDILTKLG
jgi:hypothetical protein